MGTLIWTADDASDIYGWTPARKPVIAHLVFIEDDIEVEDEDDESWWNEGDDWGERRPGKADIE